MSEESTDLDEFDNIGEYWGKQAKDIELQIQRIGVVLGIDWNDEVQVRALANESLNRAKEDVETYINQSDPENYQLKEKITLFALADMMMQIMAKTAVKDIHTHGGPAWKAFSRALMKERGILPRES